MNWRSCVGASLLALLLGTVGLPAHAAPKSMSTVDANDPQVVEAMLPLMTASELAEAEQVLREHVARKPGSAAAHESLGTALAFAGRLDEAVAVLERAAALEPGRATIYTKLGEIAQARGQDEAAIALYRRAIAADSHESRAQQRLGLHYEALGDIRAAIRHFEEGLQGAAPEDLGIRLALGRLYAQTGQGDRTIELLAAHAKDSDRHPEIHRVIGGAYLESGDLLSAIRHLRAAVTLQPHDMAGLDALAAALERHGDVDLALVTYRRLIAESNARPAVYVRLGALLLATGRGEEAATVYSEGLRRQPDEAGLLRGLSSLELRDGDPERALEHALRIRALYPDTATDAFHRGLVFERLGRTTDAEQAYREAITIEPASWPAMNNLAVLLVATNRAAEGLAYAERAAGFVEGHGAVLHTLGWSLWSTDRHREAVETLQRAHAIHPEVPVVNYHLGLAYASAGEAELGHDFVARALELDPDFPYADEARAFLSPSRTE
jgi:Flp pilus assembly protein TadD